MRCRTREEPWGSHHVEARALKCDISEAFTEGESVCGGGGGGVEEEALDVFVLWYRLAMEGMVTHEERMLRRNRRAVAVVRRGINAFIAVTGVWGCSQYDVSTEC
jgi:hypothetical protein